MKILLNDEERCDELETLIKKLNDLKQECESEDIKEDIYDLLIKYTPQYEAIKERVQEEYRKEKAYQNLEYEMSVWAD